MPAPRLNRAPWILTGEGAIDKEEQRKMLTAKKRLLTVVCALCAQHCMPLSEGRGQAHGVAQEELQGERVLELGLGAPEDCQKQR